MPDHDSWDHTGIPGVASGDVATDPIWTTAGMVARATGTATATEQWPPGHEFNYAQVTSGAVSVTATTEATANTLVTAGAVTYDGSTVIMLEFFAPQVTPQPTNGVSTNFYLYDGSSSVGIIGQITHGGTAQIRPGPVNIKYRFTPSAATKTYSIRASTASGTATVGNGAGGAAALIPMFIRQTKA